VPFSGILKEWGLWINVIKYVRGLIGAQKRPKERREVNHMNTSPLAAFYLPSRV